MASPYVASLLEGITRRAIEAVNNRQWNPLSDPWIYFGSGEIYDEAWRNDIISAMGADLESMPPTGHKFVDLERAVVQLAPEFHVRIINITTTTIDESPGFQHATVLLEADEMGVPSGVVRPCLVAFSYEKGKEGRWLCTSLRSVAGIDWSSRHRG